MGIGKASRWQRILGIENEIHLDPNCKQNWTVGAYMYKQITIAKTISDETGLLQAS